MAGLPNLLGMSSLLGKPTQEGAGGSEEKTKGTASAVTGEPSSSKAPANTSDTKGERTEGLSTTPSSTSSSTSSATGPQSASAASAASGHPLSLNPVLLSSMLYPGMLLTPGLNLPVSVTQLQSSNSDPTLPPPAASQSSPQERERPSAEKDGEEEEEALDDEDEEEEEEESAEQKENSGPEEEANHLNFLSLQCSRPRLCTVLQLLLCDRPGRRATQGVGFLDQKGLSLAPKLSKNFHKSNQHWTPARVFEGFTADYSKYLLKREDNWQAGPHSCSPSCASVALTMATKPQGGPGKPRFSPDDRLAAMFRTCSRDPTEAIKARLRRMLHTFLQHHRDNAGNENTDGTLTDSMILKKWDGGRDELAKKCCCQAGIWYFRILEKGASQERKRLGISDLSVIFETDLFQRCLVACCLEVTIFSNSLPCDFPLVLQIFKLAPHHFWRVIELVVRAEAGLPRSVVRHLAQVEEKVLESLAWTSNSPLWEEIRANQGCLPTCQQVMPLTQLENPTDLSPDGNLPGVGPSTGAEQPASTDQQRSPSPLNRPRQSNPLHLFARKVYSLMSRRLRRLCSIMDISDELRLKIWTCFEHSLVHCTDLMKDRHLDQLLLCATYIIPKITKVEIPFRSIMMYYKSQPLACKSRYEQRCFLFAGLQKCADFWKRHRKFSHWKQHETRAFITLLIADNGDHSNSLLTPNTPSTHYTGPCQEERGNLIYFYNQVYSTKMENFAKKFAPTPGGDTPPLSPYPQQWKACSRRHQLSSSIFISPHNKESTSPCTPGLCYYFNSSPPDCLREINNMIKTGRSPNRRSYAVLLGRGEEEEEEEEEEEDGPSAKRLRLDGQSAWQRRLRNVVNDRVTTRDRHRPPPVTKPNLH
ncbi:hypothetical protein L3Q82_008847 [Scortum barcoo]|uniref:Uncharacterized protein n=1 Tax=Scortum barcoo TaxID=214431 RepID=A0ACB8XCM2_9TELE|nr:hypothetical protein L3Q82_008847 [Scortum barcoo]